MVLREIGALFRGNKVDQAAARRNGQITANIVKTHLPARTERINQTLQIGQSLQVTEGGSVPFSINYLTDGTMAILYSNGRGYANYELSDGGFIEARGMVVTRSGENVSIFGVTNLQNGNITEQIGPEGFLFVRDSGSNLYGINNTSVFLYNREGRTGKIAVTQWSDLVSGENLLGDIKITSDGNGRVTIKDNSPAGSNNTMALGSGPLLSVLNRIDVDREGFDSVEGTIYSGSEGYGEATLRYGGKNYSLTCFNDGSWGFGMSNLVTMRRNDQPDPIDFSGIRIEKTGDWQFRIFRTESNESVLARARAKVADISSPPTEIMRPVSTSVPMFSIEDARGQGIISEGLTFIQSAEFWEHAATVGHAGRGSQYIRVSVEPLTGQFIRCIRKGNNTERHYIGIFISEQDGSIVRINTETVPHLQRIAQAIQSRYNAELNPEIPSYPS